MTDIKMYLVGGAVRDELLGVRTKDFDYSVVVSPDMQISVAWDLMRQHLVDQGFHIFLETPQYLTIRARFPKGHVNEKITADFVLARKDGPYTDGRRPDWVVAGTLEDDIFRRDFTVNALAKDEQGNLIDLVGGVDDLDNRRIRAVGDAKERLFEDPLRAFRAIRFAITKNMRIDPDIIQAIRTVRILDKMYDVAGERVRDELYKAFAHDSAQTMLTLVHDFPILLPMLKHNGIWLMPTLKEV